MDIFQHSNMYTLKPSISRLASDETVMLECATYVTRPGYAKSSWPALLRLYSKLLPGVTVHDWTEQNKIAALGIDPRRFVSFGIIKGFLRRIHRWPILVERGVSPLIPNPDAKRRVGFDKSARIGSSLTLSTRTAGDSGLTRSGPGDSTFTLRSQASNASLGVSPSRTPPSVTRSPRRPVAFTSMRGSLPRSLNSAADTHPSMSSKRTLGTLKHGALKLRDEQTRLLEEDLVKYLDGSHHTDEIQVRFRLGWRELERILGLDELVDGKGKKGIALVYR